VRLFRLRPFAAGLAAAVVGLMPAVGAHAHPGATWITPKQAQKQLLGAIIWMWDLPPDLGQRLTAALHGCENFRQGIIGGSAQDCDEYTQLNKQATPVTKVVTARCTGLGASHSGTYIHFRCSASNRLPRTYLFVMHNIRRPTATSAGMCVVFLREPQPVSTPFSVSACYTIFTARWPTP
jgi:hypothetical protein